MRRLRSCIYMGFMFVFDKNLPLPPLSHGGTKPVCRNFIKWKVIWHKTRKLALWIQRWQARIKTFFKRGVGVEKVDLWNCIFILVFCLLIKRFLTMFQKLLKMYQCTNIKQRSWWMFLCFLFFGGFFRGFLLLFCCFFFLRAVALFLHSLFFYFKRI